MDNEITETTDTPRNVPLFSPAKRGYSTQEVDQFIDKSNSDYETLLSAYRKQRETLIKCYEELKVLREVAKENIAGVTKFAEILAFAEHCAGDYVQKNKEESEKALAAAKAEANRIIKQAKKRANKIVRQANAQAKKNEEGDG